MLVTTHSTTMALCGGTPFSYVDVHMCKNGHVATNFAAVDCSELTCELFELASSVQRQCSVEHCCVLCCANGSELLRWQTSLEPSQNDKLYLSS